MTAYYVLGLSLIAMLTIAVLLVGVVVVGKIYRDRAEARYARILAETLPAPYDDSALNSLDDVYRGVGRGDDFYQRLLLDLVEEWDTDGVFRDPVLTDRLTLPSAALARDRLMLQLDDREPAKRGLAVAIGGYPPTFLTTIALSKMLDDPDGETALAAAAVLEHIGTTTTAWVLIDAMERQALPWPRIVERIDHDWALPVILEALQRPQDPQRPDIRPWLARAAGLVGDPAAVPVLIPFISNENAEIRLNAVRAVGMCARRGDPVAREWIRWAARDSFEGVRNQAMKALGLIGTEEDVPIIVEALDDFGWFTRWNAAEALIEIGGEGLKALQKATSHEDRYAASQAREALARALIESRSSGRR